MRVHYHESPLSSNPIPRYRGKGQYYIPELQNLYYVLIAILYIPCLIVIYKHIEQPCYKIMFFIGIIDVVGLIVTAFLPGLFCFIGYVYCSSPVFMYSVGVAGYALLSTETMAAILLAANRCISMAFSDFEETLFRGYRTWLWLTIPTVYSLWFAYISKPTLFSAYYGGWHLNPHEGYIPYNFFDYFTPYDFWHEVIIVCGYFGFYGLFFVLMIFKFAQHSLLTKKHIFTQKMIFLQVLILSLVNSANASIYIMADFITIPPVILIAAIYTWIVCHGIPPVIYLTLNKTIQTDCRNLFFGKKKHKKKIHTTVVSTNTNQVSVSARLTRSSY
ncbi:serpentine type 7TM GPCR chemoreceptor srt domain-containing protein [Ditylenchus destructor]|uniref:Serpentine type 7TM GPCR chemoreceptor srt domain-containing protein n=1 Tax=Ditylenchus destructor TaxID=166010 RepID=A0AAD4MWK1_9BILA|nr:serpentine type 7TM GPCR chemoreceptor srt domain-containing protein [Ditylenchus destructor]